MIAKDETRASESNHWYTRNGEPMYTVESAKGTQRPTTLRDARKLNLVPSVTTVLNVLNKPGLNKWMQQQVLLAALTLPRREQETEDDWVARIVEDSKEQGRNAADVGTSIHAAIQGFYDGRPSKAYEDYVGGCVNAILSRFGHQPWVSERAFAHEIGFGGKCDLFAPGFVLDIKTKEFTKPGFAAYDEHMMQLAAYRVGLGMPEARCANVFVSRNVPGLVEIVEWEEEDLQRGWQMFHAILSFWQSKNRHK